MLIVVKTSQGLEILRDVFLSYTAIKTGEKLSVDGEVFQRSIGNGCSFSVREVVFEEVKHYFNCLRYVFDQNYV